MSHSREIIVPKKDTVMDLLDKGSKIIILKMLKDVKKAVWRKSEEVYLKKMLLQIDRKP